MIELFWALLEIFGLVFKESPFCISKVSVLDIFLQIDMRLTACLHTLCYLFYLPLCQVSPTRINFGFSLSDISYSSQQQQLQETLHFTEGTCNITKMFSHYFQDTSESVTGFCAWGREVTYSMQISSNSHVLMRRYIISHCSYELLHFMDVAQIAQVR